MVPWSTRRLTLLFLVVFMLSMVAPPVPSGLAEDAATPEVQPEVVLEPPPADAPPPPMDAPVEVADPDKPVDAPPATEEVVVPADAPVSRQPGVTLAPETDGDVTQLGTIAITVIDSETSAPISGASVFIEFVGAGTTGVDGRFVVVDVPVGTYYVEANADTHYGGYTYVDVYGAVEFSIALDPLPEPGVLTVIVADAVTGVPVADAWVTVYGVTSGPAGDGGVFETGELATGSYFGDVTADGYLLTFFDAYIDGATSITVLLQPIVPGTLTVKVVSMGTGDPIAGATVVVYNPNGHVYVTEGPTGEDGFFSVTLPGGGYDVEVDAPGFIPGYAYPYVNGETFIQIDLARLPLPGALTVTVVDGDSTLPLEGASVKVLDQAYETVAAGSTGTDGLFLTDQLAAGYYVVEATMDGYGYANASLVLDGDSGVTMPLFAVQATSLTVHVTDQSTGMGVANATVVVTDFYDGRDVGSAVTDDTGVAVFEVPEGMYHVVVLSDAHYRYEADVYSYGATDIYPVLEPRVAGDITLVVLDASTWQPLAGVAVTILDAESGIEVASGVTGEDGSLPIVTLEGGSYDAIAEADGYVGATTRFLVRGPETVTLLIERQPGIMTLHVTDAVTAQPIADATVALHDMYGQPYGGGVTDGDGVFVTGQLPGGSYLVEATADGYLYASISVDLRGDTVAELTMEPATPGVLTVTVLDEETGALIRRATVRVLDGANVEVASGETGKDGRFATATLPSGQYQVRVTADGYDDGRTFPFINGPTDRTVSLRPQLPGTLVIHVVDELTGEPVGKASVVVYDTSRNMVASGKTGKTGEFRTSTLPEGEYIVDVSASGYYPVRSWVWVHGETDHLIGLIQRLDGTLTVTVIGMEIQAPISGAVVTVFDRARAEVARGVTDADGVYVSEVLTSGDYAVVVSADGYMTTQDLYVRVNGESALAVSLDPATPGPLFIDVYDAGTYMGLPGAAVVVRDAVTGEEVAQGVTNEGGSFATPELAGGDYVVRITASGYAPATEQVRVNGFASMMVMLQAGELTTPGMLTLSVSSQPSGELVGGAFVQVVDAADLEEVAAGTTDPTGIFVTEELPAGDYVVRVDADFHLPWASSVVIDGPVDVTATVDLVATASIQVVPFFAEPGGKVTVTGEGFAPSEPVRITWNVPGGTLLAEVKASKDGTISCSVKIPDDASWSGTVIAVGMDSSVVGVGYIAVSMPGVPQLVP